jgi:hypothetical protein
MWKAAAALVAAAAIAGALTLLPGLSADVSASVPNSSVKTDRYDATECERVSWPYYGRECLKDRNRNAGRSLQVRLVSTDRLYREASGPLPEWAAYLPATGPTGAINFTVGR